MSPFLHRLARHLRKARRTAGLTQEQIADLIGCSLSTVERAESGSYNTRAHVIDEWERVTGIAVIA